MAETTQQTFGSVSLLLDEINGWCINGATGRASLRPQELRDLLIVSVINDLAAELSNDSVREELLSLTIEQFICAARNSAVRWN